MRRYLMGIFLCFAIVFGINEIKGEIVQESQTEVSAKLSNTNETEANRSSFREAEDTIALASEYLFNVFNLSSCDVPIAISSTPRGISFSKNVRSSATQILSTLDVSSLTRNSKNLYSHFCFNKSSYRYFVYTLRRILI